MLQKGRLQALLLGLSGIFLAIGLVGCSDDLYSECNPEKSLGCDEDANSCVAEPDFQCETRVCAKYKGSQPFCTKQCESDGDCEGGACKSFVLGSEEKYCVESGKVK